jgi:hypothetical protein
MNRLLNFFLSNLTDYHFKFCFNKIGNMCLCRTHLILKGLNENNPQ